MIGKVLGHCRVLAKIGEGGMGVVYRAHDEVLHRDVALKVVKNDTRLDSTTSQSLLYEARASSSLSHPNICTIHEVGESEGDLYIVMELVEGKSLRSLSADAGLPAESVLRYGVQIASALARAHDRGIIHRDLKTANIVVTPDGLVKVLDFGLAKQVGSGIFEGSTRSFATVQDASSVSGTLPYMAPEILRGDPADYRTDLWALGVVLYETASGRLPFEGRTGFEISSAIMPLIQTRRGLRCCIACNTFISRKETPFCWLEPQREHSSFARMVRGAVGRLAVPIFTGTAFMRWPMTAVEDSGGYGRPRRVIGARSCDPATTSGRAGVTLSRHPFDFPLIPGSP